MIDESNEPSEPPSDGILHRLARAIDERRAVDWDREASRHPEYATAIRALEDMDRMAGAHEEIRRQAPPEPEGLLAGTHLSHYHIVERIAIGGMGVVYRARDERLQRDVALKVVRADRVGTARARESLVAEARLACAITHPNLAAIYDVGEDGDLIFCAMEWVEGEPLSDLVRRRPLTPKSAIQYGVQIASALQAVHERGIVHCDVKALNIRITKTGVAKLLDFGIAMRSASEASASAPAASPGQHVVSGTIPYMAPESLRGERPDARSDVWSFGVTLFESVTGRLPFQGETRAQVVDAILHAEPAPLPGSVPTALRRVLERCLRKDRAQRYADAGEARAALEELRDALPKRSNRRAVVGAAIAALLLVLVAAWLGTRSARTGDGTRSMAIWPVRNESGMPDQQFLADGLTNQLTTTFARFAPLRILSRASSEAMAREGRRLPELAKRYDLDYVLETSVARRGDRIEVTSRLRDARRDETVWSRTYERPVQEIAAIDRQIAQEVGARFQSAPVGERSAAGERPSTVDLAAYEAYVKGRESAATREYRRALSYYAAASQRDSSFAAVHAAIADCYTEMLYYGEISAAEGLARGSEAAQRALRLDSNQASPHLALAMIHGLRWEWKQVEDEIDRALREEPSNSEAWYRRSLYCGVTGRRAEHVAAMERAVALDPLSVRLTVELGLAYLNAGKVSQAAEQFRRVASGEGHESRRARAYEARCLVLEGRPQQAIAQLTMGARGKPAVFEQEELAYAYAKAGLKAKAVEAVRTLRSPEIGVLASPLAIAAAQVGWGDPDTAFETLTAAVERHEPRLVWIQVDQRFDPIRRDPRYGKLLAGMGLARPGPS